MMTPVEEKTFPLVGHPQLVRSGRPGALIRAADRTISRLYLKFFNERASLMVFQYHGLFENEKDIRRHVVDPQQGITVHHLRQFIDYFLSHGYRFVSIRNILDGLSPGSKYAMITFDDGYYNNSLALPVLAEYDVPAVIYISVHHVRDGKAFWWDVVYRERTSRGAPAAAVSDEVAALKMKDPDGIEAYLHLEFGANCLKPIGDIDRPFTVRELTELAMNRHVGLGNHTCNHAILARCSPSRITAEVGDAQRYLGAITGFAPESIAYPNGEFTRDVIDICRTLGLRLGLSSLPGKTALPISLGSGEAMALRRFCLWGRADVIRQCEWYRSDLRLYEKAVRLRKALTSRIC